MQMFSILDGYIRPLSPLINDELRAAWGPLGQPGSEADIARVCSYLADACSNILHWEERLASMEAEEVFSGLYHIMRGCAGPIIVEVSSISNTIDEMLSGEVEEGTRRMHLVIRLPEGLEERFAAELERVKLALGVSD